VSTFGVFIENIESITNHPNADRLEIAQLAGITYPFIIAKGSFKPGDLVLYFPVDAVLPEPLLEKIGLKGKLAGKTKNRVKTIRLRGCISQGVVASPGVLPADVVNISAGQDFAPVLGVVKYEPEEHVSGGANASAINLCPLPSGVSKYDIENCERCRDPLARLMDAPVMITEKLEGSHIALTRFPDGKTVLCTRRTSLDAEGETYWHVGARNSRLYETIEMVYDRYPDCQVTLRGELLGPAIQGNIYGLKGLMVMLFEIEVNGTPVDADVFLEISAVIPTDTAPLLAPAGKTLRDWMGTHTDIRIASNGKSVIGDTLREGIVIKPMTEEYDRHIGRLFLKQRSPEYLATVEL
jgi:RNA ligase (TIGR02306 family)